MGKEGLENFIRRGHIEGKETVSKFMNKSE